ncbi:uncharacterized protein LOC108095708 [Drosophila ficusphila]|uniref:uncharacterized protein LOC108095708 n=1 Tax=Drosophila ficusphila TaxID=30025 RepID=UPI0007E6761E|nr:uncharacterized protein LOC108095708 [Drosophila ficusphila]
MNWNFLICLLLGHSFAIAIEASCLRGTGHMWQEKNASGTGVCHRLSMPPRNAIATASTKPSNTTAEDIAAATMRTSAPEVAETITIAAPPAVVLANYVYECASRRTAGSCSKRPEPESKPEFGSGPEPEVPKPQTVTLAVGQADG